MTAQDIILRPIITENSMDGVTYKRYTFKVAPRANKAQIAAAVEELFNVKVADVHTINMKGKPRRQGYTSGYTSAWKKAIVKLTKESKPIDFFEGLM